MMFQIDKSFVVNSYKDYLQKKDVGKNYDNDSQFNKNKGISIYSVLTKILDMYKLIRKFSFVQARKEYIHDEEEFEKIKAALHTNIRNKIRTSPQGSLYITVNGNISFSGDDEEYKKWIVNDKNKTFSLIRNIVDEFNKTLRGEEIKDNNKPLLNDERKESIYIINNIPKEHIDMCVNGNFDKFNESFQRLMIGMGIEENERIKIAEDIKDMILVISGWDL